MNAARTSTSSGQEQLKKVSEETMRFMRGSYELDEVSNGTDELKFRRGSKTVLTIYLREDHFVFLLIFGKAERATFEAYRADFPQELQDIYDTSKTYHDGKWMKIPVADVDTLESVKRMIEIKKKPNRKPFSKEGALYSKCGMRCDLCAHYAGSPDKAEFRKMLQECVNRVYCDGVEQLYADCPGCGEQSAVKPHPCMNGDSCEPLKCVQSKHLDACTDCENYPCDKAVAGYRNGIEARSMSAEDITWGILPYVEWQYGN